MSKKGVSPVGIAVRVLIIIGLSIAIYYVWQWRTSGPMTVFETVGLGDAREAVVQRMGQPTRESETFPLPKEPKLAEDATKVTAETWLLWDVGMGVTCVVGLDEGDRVVYKGNTGR